VCVRCTDLGVEEDLRPQEALVAHVDGELLLADRVDAGVGLHPLGGVRVVLAELLDQVWTHVAEPLLGNNGGASAQHVSSGGSLTDAKGACLLLSDHPLSSYTPFLKVVTSAGDDGERKAENPIGCAHAHTHTH